VTEVEQFIGYVREVPLEQGASAIRMPGESGAATAQRRLVEGVRVQAFTWRALHALAAEFDLEPPASRQEPHTA
jgi:LDH2 family malate/lactate/ureidoglycolate dehydrogenase